ncbi:MAG: hypothetical protein WC455_19880 [Dehalococcoidia bacterium]|jgi:hypothetical protein
MKEMKQHVRGILWTVIGVTIVAYAVALYLAYWPVNVMVLRSLEIQNANIIPGGVLYYRLSYEKNLPAAATVVRQIINRNIMTYPPINSNIKTGRGEFVGFLDLPTAMSPGPHRMRLSLIYQVNPFRTVVHSIESPEFIIQKGLH